MPERARIWPSGKQELGILPIFSIWVSGTQIVEPAFAVFQGANLEEAGLKVE